MTGFNQEHTFHEKTDTPRHVQTLSCLQIYSYDEWVMMKHTPIPSFTFRPLASHGESSGVKPDYNAEMWQRGVVLGAEHVLPKTCRTVPY